MGFFEQTLLIRPGVGVGALDVSEELVLDEVLGNGAAVLDDEGAVGTLSGIVNRRDTSSLPVPDSP